MPQYHSWTFRHFLILWFECVRNKCCVYCRYILWELAIAFSPERSESAERRLGLETQVEHGAEGGRIYTEVLRLNHCNLRLT